MISDLIILLNRFFESLTVSLFNRWLDGRSRRAAGRGKAVADDHVVIGHSTPVPGSRDGRGEAVTLSPEARRKHLYAIGATGCGKTNLMLRLIESDIASRRTFCVIDLRGDLVDRILMRLARTETPQALRERLLLLDLRQEQHIVGFNPLIGEGDPYNRAFHLLSVLKRQSESWGVQLEETLRNSLLALSETGWSLLELEALLNPSQAAFRSQVLAHVSDSYVRSFFERYGQLSADRQLSWMLPVTNKVTPLLAIPQLRLMFGQRESFSFNRLLDEQPGRILLISLGVDRLHGAAHLVGGMLVSAFQTAVMARVDRSEADRNPVHLYIDEFETMATERFEAIIAEGRRFGVGLCLSHQNCTQLPASLKHVIRNNVHAQFLFQTGGLDAAELGQEVHSREPKEAVRAALMAQDVGECHLVRRAQPTLRVRVCHSPDPEVPAEALLAVRTAGLQAYSRPRDAVEAELAEREIFIRSLGQYGPGMQPAMFDPLLEVRRAPIRNRGKQRPQDPK
jgi:hypothetical protein